MVSDSTRLIYFANTLPADSALLGQKAVSGVLPSGRTLFVDLYGGTSSGSLTLQRTTTINAAILGGFGPSTFTSVNLPGGIDAFFQIRVRDDSTGFYSGHSEIFTMRPSSSIAFNAINNIGGTSLSTWQLGTFSLGGGEFGAIPIGVPEPSNVAFVGLASFLFFRRRK